MPKRIYVGNLPFTVEEKDILGLFKGKAEVESVEITRETKGESAMCAVSLAGSGDVSMKGLDGAMVGGRKVVASTDREAVANQGGQGK